MSRIPAIVAQPVPTGQVDTPFYVGGDVAGDVPTLHANAGTSTEAPSTAEDRRLAGSVPWAAAARPMLRKLTHFRAPGAGDPMWSGRCSYDLAGASPSFSYYDDPDSYVRDDGLEHQVGAGTSTVRRELGAEEPSATRRSRVAAHYDSAPAAGPFQGFANLRWSGMMAGFRPVIAPRPLHANFNPGQMGSKELHRATQYQPVPPMGAITGYFGTEKAL